DHTWAAMQGREALKVTWDEGPNAQLSSAAISRAFAAAADHPGEVLRNDGDAQAALAGSVPLFVLLMVLIVIFLFNALRQPLIIWMSVPLAMIGVTVGLLITGQPFGFMALLGILSLIGMLIKNAIVLIDEIDLHLHPSWQRMVVPKLTKVFPSCQFVISTHSPQVLGEVKGGHVRRLFQDPEKGLCVSIPKQAFGLNSSEVLEELMESPSRNEVTTGELHEVFQRIDDERFSDAKKKIDELSARVNGSIPELVRARALITMLDESLAD
ncbi:hypothetical protein LCGC14_3033920, partial [marine sediment metagenome]